MVPFRRPNRNALPVLATLAAALCTGCGEDEVPVVTIFHPTLVEVSPAEFLGNVPCVDAVGALRRYVATVFDAGPRNPDGTDDAGDPSDFSLPSSTVAHADVNGDGEPDATPIPCTQAVGFSRVVPGNRYWAVIEGYERDDLVALAPGTSILYDSVTSERVTPRWRTSCSMEQPVMAFAGVARTIGRCEALEDATPGTETLIEVSIDGALGDLECGDAEGAIERFEVTPPGADPVSVACGETATFAPAAGSGTSLSLELRAFEAGASDPSWTTTCVARVLPGVRSPATCLPLVAEETAEVDPEQVEP